MSVSSGSIYSRAALCLRYANQSLFLENSLGLLLLKQWLPFQLSSPSLRDLLHRQVALGTERLHPAGSVLPLLEPQPG